MLQVLATTLATVQGGVLDVIKQRDTLKEQHLFTLHHLAIYWGNHFRRSGASLCGAFDRFVGTTANGTLPVPPILGALGHDMSCHLAPVAPGDMVVAWVCIMEDGHLHSSPSIRWEWDYSPNNPRCLSEGGLDWSVARAYRDWVDKVVLVIQFLVHIANLQPFFTEAQLPFDSHQLFHDLHDPSLGVLHQPFQGILEITQSPELINFPMILGLVNLGKHHVDGEFPLVPTPQMSPLGQGHGGVSGDPPIHLDRARAGLCSNTSTSFYQGIVGRVFDVRGHNKPLVGPVPFIGMVERVPDINVVEEEVVGVIVNKSWRWDRGLVFFVGLLWVLIVDLRVFVFVVLALGNIWQPS